MQSTAAEALVGRIIAEVPTLKPGRGSHCREQAIHV
jgi:hypothetical protein